jgi:OmcA/MtrC family decaheme c-type cytochrome
MPYLLLALAALGLAACEGDTIKRGAEGPSGPAGPPGNPGTPNFPLPAASATALKVQVTSVSVPADGRPIVNLYITDQQDRAVTGLPAGNVYFVLARLESAVNGQSSTWHAITRRTEAFPGSPAPQPAQYVTGTGPTNQGYTEPATTGTWVDNGNGTFRYTYKASLTTDPQIPYDPSLPHRVGLEIRLPSSAAAQVNVPANNAPYTFNPATGAPIAQSGREIVDNAGCNTCHDKLSAHGNARFDLDYCSMCHETYSYDAQSGNTIDLKVLIHKIHSGRTLPSVEAGGFYGIFGFGNLFQNYSDVVYTQDIRNCETCHRESDPETPQASSWRLTVNRASCGSCHDTTNFDTGANHAGVAATDDTCITCHGPTSSLQGGQLQVPAAHVDPVAQESGKFRYEILSVVDTAPGKKPTVTIRVVDPTNGNKPYDIKAPTSPFQGDPAASLAVDVAWSTRPDFTNTGSGSATPTTGTPAQPVRIDFKANGVPDPAVPGAFKATAALAIPAFATGSGSALVEGRPTVDVNGDGVRERIPVPSVGKAFAITDTAAVPYRKIVAIERCDDCHAQLSLHGESRTNNAELCAICHNPNATDINRRVAGSNCQAVTGTLDDQTIDFKVMVHAIHAGPIAGYKVCGFNNTGYDFSHVRYPGKLNNCEGCHLPGTYYPPEPGAAFATTTDAAPPSAPDRASPAGDIATTPGPAVCTSCHRSDSARLHMTLNGGAYDAVKAANSTTPTAPLETCSTCHGPGRSADVKVLHKIDEYNSN